MQILNHLSIFFAYFMKTKYRNLIIFTFFLCVLGLLTIETLKKSLHYWFILIYNFTIQQDFASKKKAAKAGC